MPTRPSLPSLIASIATAAAQSAETIRPAASVRPGAAETIAPIAKQLAGADDTVRQFERIIQTAGVPILWYQSPVLIGLLVSMVAVIARLLGFTLTDQFTRDLTELFSIFGAIAGIGIAAYGRLRSPVQPVVMSKSE